MSDALEPPLPPLIPNGDSELIDRARVLCLTAGVLLLLLGAASAWMRPQWEHSSVWLPLAFGVGGALPWFAIARSLRGTPPPFALGAGSVLCWVVIATLVVLPVVTIIFGLLALFGGGRNGPLTLGALQLVGVLATLKSAVPSAGYVLLIALVVVSFTLRSRLRALAHVVAPASSGRGAGGLAVLVYCAALAFVTSKANYAVMTTSVHDFEDQQKQLQLSKANTRKALRLTQVCLTAYAAAHPSEGYPATLAALGPAGNACVDASVAGGVVGLWKLRYVAVADSVGPSSGYWIVAEPMVRMGRGEVFYANESGIVYLMQNAAREDSMLLKRTVIPSPLPPAVGSYLVADASPVPVLIKARRCLLDLQTSQRYLPARIRDSRCASYPMRVRGLELLAELYPALGNEGTTGTYRVTYVASAQAPDTTLVAFTLSARPVTYGVDGLRSYLVDATGATHWTLLDRDATVNDPVVSPCETGSGTQCRYPGSGEAMDTTR